MCFIFHFALLFACEYSSVLTLVPVLLLSFLLSRDSLVRARPCSAYAVVAEAGSQSVSQRASEPTSQPSGSYYGGKTTTQTAIKQYSDENDDGDG